MFPKGFLEAVLVVGALIYVFKPLILEALHPAAIELGQVLQLAVARWRAKRKNR
jgi:hypothetical protein